MTKKCIHCKFHYCEELTFHINVQHNIVILIYSKKTIKIGILGIPCVMLHIWLISFKMSVSLFFLVIMHIIV